MATFNYKRIRAVDLLEVAADQGGATTITQAIAAMQGNAGQTHNCPKCQVEGTPTGWNTIPTPIGTTTVICSVCDGTLKTVQEYMPDPLRPGEYIALVIGGTISIQLQAATSQLSASVAGGQWTSANTDKATVNANTGLVTAVGLGTSVITYTSGEYSTNVTFTVTSNG